MILLCCLQRFFASILSGFGNPVVTTLLTQAKVPLENQQDSKEDCSAVAILVDVLNDKRCVSLTRWLTM